MALEAEEKRGKFLPLWKLTLSGCINNICIIIKVSFAGPTVAAEELEEEEEEGCNYYMWATLSRVIVMLMWSYGALCNEDTKCSGKLRI